MLAMGFARVSMLSSAVLFAIACAADPGDALKTDSTGMGSLDAGASGSGSGSGGGSGSGSTSGGGSDSPSSDDAAPAGGDDATLPEAAAPDDAPTVTVEASPPPPTCTTCPITVEYYTRNPSPPASTNTVRFDVSITNNGSMPQGLSELTLRYWFTADGASSFAFNEYYAASPINGNVMGAFTQLTASTTPAATATADTYFEVSFNAAAGSIAAMSSTDDIQLAFNDTTYKTNFNEANDYSYTGTDSMATCAPGNNVITCQSPTVTLYRGGMLVWGTEPGGMQAPPPGDP